MLTRYETVAAPLDHAGYIGTGMRRVQINTFDSMFEFIREAQRPVPWEHRMSRLTQRKAFNRVREFEQAVDLAQRGWKEGVERVYRLREGLIEAIGLPSTDFTPRYDVAGSDVDVQRFLSGHPESMVDAPLDYSAKKDVVFTVDINIACGGCPYRACTMVPIPVDATFMRGAALAMVAEALEKRGNRVGIKVQLATEFTTNATGGGAYGSEHTPMPGDNRYVLNEVWIKRPAEFLDLNRIIFATAHTGMVGQLEFSLTEAQRHREGMSLETYNNLNNDVSVRHRHGHGTSNRHGFYIYGAWYEGEIRPVPQDLRGPVHIDNLQRMGFRDETAMLKWALDTLKDNGVEIKQ